MANEVRITGLDELLADLARLAPDLAAEARPLQARAAEATASELRAAYPSVTGELRNSVQVDAESSASEARVFSRLSVTSRHAAFYEFGTAHTAPHPTFTPIARRGRAAFLADVIDRVKARGLVVSGDPGNA